MKILITGVTGFTGNKLALSLLEKKFTVVGLSRSEKLIDHPHYNHIQTDLSSQNFTDKLPGGVEVIYHLAQSKKYRDFEEGAEDMFSINIESTFRLLQWGKKNNIQKFIFSSTGNVYQASESSLTEEDPCVPNSFYGASKLCAEQLALQYCASFQVFICRIFGIYGPSQKNMLIPNLVNNMLQGKPVTLAGGKGLVMNPIYIDDCVSLLQRILTIKEPGIVNLAGPQTISIADIVNLVEDESGKIQEKIITAEAPKYLVGSTQKMNQLFGEFKFTSFKEGFSKVMSEYIKTN